MGHLAVVLVALAAPILCQNGFYYNTAPLAPLAPQPLYPYPLTYQVAGAGAEQRLQQTPVQTPFLPLPAISTGDPGIMGNRSPVTTPSSGEKLDESLLERIIVQETRVHLPSRLHGQQVGTSVVAGVCSAQYIFISTRVLDNTVV